jgi:hypothetical protein
MWKYIKSQFENIHKRFMQHCERSECASATTLLAILRIGMTDDADQEKLRAMEDSLMSDVDEFQVEGRRFDMIQSTVSGITNLGRMGSYPELYRYSVGLHLHVNDDEAAFHWMHMKPV